MKKLAMAVVAAGVLAGCARLDHVQIGEIDQTQGQLKAFSIQVSEIGFDAAATAEIGRQATRGQASEQLQTIRDILALMNMGPRTGNPVYDDTYANKLVEYVYAECPTGKMTGLKSIREAKGFGPVTGEIVRIDGYCIL